MSMDVDKLLGMQRNLMEQVPHDVRPDVLPRMVMAIATIDKLLLYLTSLGHKPWRPNPLSEEEQRKRLDNLLACVETYNWSNDVTMPVCDAAFSQAPDQELTRRKLVSTLGIIEEAIEYFQADISSTKTRAEKLEELTDELFFYLEQVALGGFTPEEIESEYIRKHAVNMKRYEDGKRGEWGWDQRQKGEL